MKILIIILFDHVKLFLATYSNSEPAVLSYTSIFETSVRRVKVVEFQSSLPHKGGQMAYMNHKSRRNDKHNRYSERQADQ